MKFHDFSMTSHEYFLRIHDFITEYSDLHLKLHVKDFPAIISGLSVSLDVKSVRNQHIFLKRCERY